MEGNIDESAIRTAQLANVASVVSPRVLNTSNNLRWRSLASPAHSVTSQLGPAWHGISVFCNVPSAIVIIYVVYITK